MLIYVTQVVLPVVARKRGLDEHYQKVDGNSAPRMVHTTPAPVCLFVLLQPLPL